MPRDIEPEVGQLDDVYLYTVDDLENTVEESLHSRRQAAKQAEEIIDTEVEHFMAWLRAQDAVTTIRDFRMQAESIRDEALSKALQNLRNDTSAEEALRLLARSLTNKLVHGPTTQIKQAGINERHELIAAAQEIFQLKGRYVKDSIKQKLETLNLRFEEIGALLSQPETQKDQNLFRALSQEYAQLNPLMDRYNKYCGAGEEIESIQPLLEDEDIEVRQLAKEEIEAAKKHMAALEKELQVLLLPKDPNDDRNIFLEIRAGTGGDEAAIFAGDLSPHVPQIRRSGWLDHRDH